MNTPVNQTALATMAEAPSTELVMGFGSASSFDLLQRAARMMAASSLVPKEYFDNIPNCAIALNIASRLRADPLMVMQNLVIVHNRPTWSAQFLIATVNTCGRFTALRFEYFGNKGQDDWGCRAWAIERSTGEKLVGTDVTIAIAKKEGWYGRNGSKWQSIPQQMLLYRAGSWWTRGYAPELSMGLPTADEIEDVVTLNQDGSVYTPGKPVVAMPQARVIEPEPEQQTSTVDQSTGEITEHAQPSEPAQPAAAIDPQDAHDVGQEPEPAKPAAEKPARKAATPSEPGALATEGERKFILNRAKSAGIEVAKLMADAGVDGLPADLAGLTKDGFVAARDLLPKSI